MTAPSRMRWRVETWDPGYGASSEDSGELGPSSAQLALGVELPEARWRPLTPHPPTDAAGEPAAVVFVDGVRRIDAMAWIEGGQVGALDGFDGIESGARGGGEASLALCASYAAGAVHCGPGGARLIAAEVRRGLFTLVAHATDVVTWAGHYPRMRTDRRGEPAVDLSLAVQRALADLEASVATTARGRPQLHHGPERGSVRGPGASGGRDAGDGRDPGLEPDLLVVDGPLRGRQHLPRVLGFIKTHRSEYLPAALHRMVGGLRAGQRTPVFGLGTSWQRYSWYLKLPGPAAPWAGVVRVECPAERPVAEVVALADRSAPLLCRYASAEYKDARAPQNLYPIAGLERELRRRLGDQALLYRAIRRASIRPEP